jgi:hypothetical protein
VPTATALPFDIAPFDGLFSFPAGSIIQPKPTPVVTSTLKAEQLIVDIPKPFNARNLLEQQVERAGFRRLNNCSRQDSPCIQDFRRGKTDLSLTFFEDRTGTHVVIGLLETS